MGEELCARGSGLGFPAEEPGDEGCVVGIAANEGFRSIDFTDSSADCVAPM